MLTATDSVLVEAGEAIYEVSADEHMRQLLEAREDALRQEIDVQHQIAEINAKLEPATAQLETTTAKLETAYALLRKHGIDPREEML